MTVNKLSGDRVLVILHKADMDDYKLDFERLSLEKPDLRAKLMRIIRRACESSEVDISGRKISVEAIMPGESCYLLLTLVGRGHSYRLKKSSVGLCYKLGASADLLDAIERLYRKSVYCARNSVYFYKGEYYIIFDYFSVPLIVKKLLSEYGEKCSDKLLAARIKEGGTVVCRSNAIFQIGRHLV